MKTQNIYNRRKIKVINHRMISLKGNSLTFKKDDKVEI